MARVPADPARPLPARAGSETEWRDGGRGSNHAPPPTTSGAGDKKEVAFESTFIERSNRFELSQWKS